MLLLALDTSGAAVTAAVHDGAAVLARHSEFDTRRHAELTAPVVRRALADAGADRRDLTAIAVGVGPGPFTGLRVGVVTALVLGSALGVPVYGVCSLDALAAATGEAPAEPRHLVVATDARRREVYWARYRFAPDLPGGPGVPERLDGPHVGPAAGVRVEGAVVTGRGCLLYPEALGESAGPLDVDAGYLAELAAGALSPGALSPGALVPGALVPDALDPGAAARVLLPPEPLYLRRPDAQAPGARKRVLR